MFDGKAEHVVSPGLVVVNDGKIVAVGRGGGNSTRRADYQLRRATLLPGFIDAHTHLSGPYQRDYRLRRSVLHDRQPSHRTEAQKCLRQRLQARDNNTLPALRRGHDLTFGEWSDFYLENFSRPPFRAPKIHKVNERALKHLRKMFETPSSLN
jgi:predicted amidohydrolase YtcJ